MRFDDRRRRERDDRPRILLVDNHADTCELYDFGLQRAGFEVFCAIDGVAALGALAAAPFAAVVLDADLPGIDGWTLIRRIKSDKSLAGLPLIMVSAHAFPDTRMRALDAGCTAFFSKPCLPHDLAESVRHAIFATEITGRKGVV